MDTSGNIDQDEDEILADTAPDEALEAAAAPGGGGRLITMNFTNYCC